MADSTLLSALTGMTTSPEETGYGRALAGLSLYAPHLANPWASTGTNLGIGLGTMLTSALLGHLAKKSAAEETLQTNKYANELLGAQDRAAYIQGLTDQGVDSDVVGKLSTLGAALTAQERANKVAAALKQQEIASELQKASILEGIKQGVFTPTAEGKIVAADVAPGTLTPADLKDIEKARQKTVAEVTAREEINKPIREAEQSKQEERDTENKFRWQQTEINRLADDVKKDRIVQGFEKIRTYNEQIKQLAQNPNRASVDKIIDLSAKMTDPDSAVTIGESLKAQKIQSDLEAFTQQLKNTTSPSPRLVQDALNKLIEASGVITDAAGTNFNKQIGAYIKRGELEKLPDVTPERLGIRPHVTQETIGKLQQIKALLDQDDANAAAGGKRMDAGTRAALATEFETIRKGM